MRSLWISMLLLACMPALAADQGANQHPGYGYVFFAPGITRPGSSAILHFGGGGEGMLYKGLGVGAELGYSFLAEGFRSGVGVFSANGSYHFFNGQSAQKLVPFVTGGYSLLFRAETANLVNFGGGLNYWFRPRAGLRVEFRDHLWPEYGAAHYFTFRVGLSLR